MIAAPAGMKTFPTSAGKKPTPSAVKFQPNSNRVGWLFLAPNLVGVILFTLVPLVSVVLLSFTSWNLVSGLGGIRFIGVQNFIDIVVDPSFWHSVGLTFIYAGVSVPVTVALGLALGIALNRNLPGRAALRAIFFLPYIVNIVAVGMTWQMILNPKAGLINQFLRGLGIQNAPGWFASSHWALPALTLMAIWGGVGYASLLFISALQDAPVSLYEAAEIDGASAWVKFRTITWPAILPTTVFLVVTLFIGTSQGFGLIALITGGGPGDSSTVLSYYLYQQGFLFYRFGYAAALGMVTFVGVLLLTLITWRAQRGKALND